MRSLTMRDMTDSPSPRDPRPAATTAQRPGHRATPDKDQIALLAPFERLGTDRITLVSTEEQAHQASSILAAASAWGFDTESKPTFVQGEQSDGPHIVQLSTLDRAWVFQLHDPGCRARVAELLALRGVTKAGFGLGDDTKRIQHKLGVQPADVLELNTVFRQQGYRKDMGVKGAVAVLFNRRFIKSKKAATSNWANARLTEAQLVYAANDAWAALRVFNALQASAAPQGQSTGIALVAS
jgi:ribonuclease D